MSYCRTYQEAVQQAQANADYFEEAFVVFSDTSGNWRCERYSNFIEPKIELQVFKPRRKD